MKTAFDYLNDYDQGKYTSGAVACALSACIDRENISEVMSKCPESIKADLKEYIRVFGQGPVLRFGNFPDPTPEQVKILKDYFNSK